MSPSPARHPRWLLALLLVWTGLAFPVLADASREYRKGLQSFRQENFPAAAASFRAAIAEDRKEGLQKIRGTGVSFEDYLPFYYLGLSLERSGQNKEALAALEESERQGAALERNETRSRLQAALSSVRSRLVEAAPTHPPPPSPTPVPAVVATPTARPVVVPTALPLATRVAVARTVVVPSPTVERIVVGGQGPAAPTPGPAAELAAVRLGAENFFRNRYEAAIELLRPHADTTPAARLLLAFSVAGRALLAEKPDEAQLAEARSLYSTALERGAKVDAEGLVSPRILELVSRSSRSENTGR